MLAIGLRQWPARRGEADQCRAQALAILAETRRNGRAVAGTSAQAAECGMAPQSQPRVR